MVVIEANAISKARTTMHGRTCSNSILLPVKGYASIWSNDLIGDTYCYNALGCEGTLLRRNLSTYSTIKTDVLRIEKYQQAMDNADLKLERGDEPVRDHVRRSSPDGRTQPKLTYTECLEPPMLAYISMIAGNKRFLPADQLRARFICSNLLYSSS